MSRRVVLCLLLGVAALVAPLGAGSARAAVGPVPVVKVWWSDTNLPPGGAGEVTVQAGNMGDEAFSTGLTIVDRLPAGVTATKITWYGTDFEKGAKTCEGLGTGTVKCELDAADVAASLGVPAVLTGNALESGYLPPIEIDVNIATGVAASGVNAAEVFGGGSVQPASDVDRVPFSKTPSSFGVVPGGFEADVFGAAYPFGEPSRQAGEHPFELRTNFDLNRHMYSHFGIDTGAPDGTVKTVEVQLPQGLIGNPEATPKCDPVDFTKDGASVNSTDCPSDTQLGYLNPLLAGITTVGHVVHVAIYNIRPPRGKLADFGFLAGGIVQGHVYPVLDPARDYAVNAVVPDIADFVAVLGSETTFWGVPADPAHDSLRAYRHKQENGFVEGAPWGSAPIRPFLTNAMDCGQENGGMRIRVDSYEHPGEFTAVQEYPHPLNVTGCEDPRSRFEPGISLEPTDTHAGAPTGLEVKLKVPQRNDEAGSAQELYAQNGFVKGIATPPIKKTVVTLPEGMTLNPSAGQGLGGCSLEQLGMSPAGVPNAEPVRCPDDSAIGTLIMHSPDLPENEPLTGRVYIARQGENPFGSLFALYLVLENAERGLLVKLAGKIELDPNTGQIKTTFDNLPQFPVSDFQLVFKGGIRAALVNPSTCGPKTITAEYFSWQDPNTPHVATDSYTITQRPDGSPCLHSLSERPFGPQLSAGTLNAIGGAFSPFTMDLTRTDEDQEISTLSITLPGGLSAKLAGVAQCPEANIAQAQNPNRTGAEEQASPSCPNSSQIGTVLVGTGTGSTLTWVPGSVYFAGPYEGAPFSIVVITPSVVGPYDLGTVVVRSALYIDPHTAQATVKTDPLPQILKGIPVRIRDVRVSIDRPQFTFNPTDCTELHVTGSSGSIDGANASLSDRFQVANCQGLAFKPKFTVSTSAKTSRANGASLNVTLSYPKDALGKDANIRMVKVSLPKQLPSRLSTLQKACADSVFDSDPAACPAASRVGVASASTPILPVPLAGPAYFVSHGGAKFPELVIVLQGDGVTVDLNGETFISKAGITSSTFRTVPDVPVERFELKLPQGPYSALTGHGDLCAAALAMPTVFTAQNGMVVRQSTPIKVSGCRAAIRVLRHSVKGAKATLTVSVPAAGRLQAGGTGLSRVAKRLGKAGTVTLTLALSDSQRRFLARHTGRRLRVRVRLLFTPAHGARIATAVTLLMG